MATLNAIRIKNLRSLVDTGWIEQKKITILVGKNSAGKSTYARFYPLLKQSVGERKQSPILWFGQYVDFGQYSVAVHDKTPNASISFSFKLSATSAEIERRNPYYSPRIQKSAALDIFELEAEMHLAKGADFGASDTVADQLNFSIFGIPVVIRFTKPGVELLTVDNKEIWRAQPGTFCHVTFDSALPRLAFYKERTITPEEQPQLQAKVVLEEYDIFSVHLFKEIRNHVHGNVGDDKVRQIANRLTIATGEELISQALVAGGDQRTWIEYVYSLRNDPVGLRRLERAIVCARLPEVLRLIDSAVSSAFSGVRYIEPLRATAQRYYRKQDLAIGELDAKGANVAQFLQGLPNWRRQGFDTMCRRLFGFTVKPRAQGGHIELVLEQTKGGNVVNMADAGVGFSQILPILLQFWASENMESDHKSRLNTAQSTTVVVEQPELHLHPAYQATLADLFCEAAMSKRGSLRIIAETHSPALVNRLGSLVASGDVAAEDIQILLFDQQPKDSSTKISIASFDGDGILTNWPFGFFEPEA